MKTPTIIQGGMGIGVSHWPLARAVSRTGQLGVVSGAAINTILLRRLQQGDASGDIRRAMAKFPHPEISEKFLEDYYNPSAKDPHRPYKRSPLFSVHSNRSLEQLTVLASFVEVFLAKDGHDGLVGINFLEKMQLSNLPGLYGAMLAGVDYVLMGAGIPREIPGVLDCFSGQQSASLRVFVHGGRSGEEVRVSFDPNIVFSRHLPHLKRPYFLPIIASATLALHLAQKSTGSIEGFVVEGPTAGGHNAPPRGKIQLNASGEPVYGRKDEVDLEKIKELGLPFWLAGGFASPEQLQEAIKKGAAGIQVGTAFAFCEESGFTEQIKSAAIRKWVLNSGDVNKEHVFTDPAASPTGFPFKVAPLEDTLSSADLYETRPRKCDLGYLRDVCVSADGALVYRCPGEPIDAYVKKEGVVGDTVGRKCLCNALFAAIGLEQCQEDGYLELPLVTAGDDLVNLRRFFQEGQTSYSARELIQYLLTPKKVEMKNKRDRVVTERNVEV